MIKSTNPLTNPLRKKDFSLYKKKDFSLYREKNQESSASVFSQSRPTTQGSLLIVAAPYAASNSLAAQQFFHICDLTHSHCKSSEFVRIN